jgi:hypothetical protein
MTTPIIDKITLLLNKAEGASTPEEAEAYFQKAQDIATKHAIDIEVARANGGSKESVLTSKRFQMGKPRQFGLYTYVELFCSVAYANDVRIAVAQNSTYVLAYGYDTDIAVVETLFTSLLLQMSNASAAYIATGEYKNEKVWRDGYMENYGGTRGREWVEAGYKPVHGSTARNSFQKAFAERVGQRLAEARRRTVNNAQTASPGTGAELVLVRKADAVAKHFDATANAKGSYTGGQGATHSRSAGQAGREAANKASIGTGSVGRGTKGELA